MKHWRNTRKPLVRYRFKDNSGFVVFNTFTTDREARIWYENHKQEYGIREFANVGTCYKTKYLDIHDTF